MSIDYYFVCTSCHENIQIKWGAHDAYRLAFDRDCPSSNEIGQFRLKQITDFLENHQYDGIGSHNILYMDEHAFLVLERDEYYKKVSRQEKEVIKIPVYGEISEVISKFIPLEANLEGALYPVGKCPFHNDDFTNLIVDVANQRFHCAECGANGNVWAFLTLLIEGKKFELHRPNQAEGEHKDNV